VYVLVKVCKFTAVRMRKPSALCLSGGAEVILHSKLNSSDRISLFSSPVHASSLKCMDDWAKIPHTFEDTYCFLVIDP
jgi:hypothetical protein